MAEPAILASYLQVLLGALPRLGPAAARAVRAIPAEVAAAAVREPDSWLPMQALVGVAESVEREWGVAGLRRWGVAGCLAGMQQPAFQPFLEASIAAGFEPVTLLQHACTAARFHFRDCGVFALESIAEDGASVFQEPLPAPLRVEPYLLFTAGMIEAFPVACGLEAAVQVRGGPAWERAEYHIGWWVPGALQ